MRSVGSSFWQKWRLEGAQISPSLCAGFSAWAARCAATNVPLSSRKANLNAQKSAQERAKATRRREPIEGSLAEWLEFEWPRHSSGATTNSMGAHFRLARLLVAPTMGQAACLEPLRSSWSARSAPSESSALAPANQFAHRQTDAWTASAANCRHLDCGLKFIGWPLSVGRARAPG